MKYCVVFGAPRSGTIYLHQLLSCLGSVEGMIGQAVSVATCHIINQNIFKEVYDALAVSVRKNIEVYLSAE